VKAFADWALDFAAFVEEVRPVLSRRIPGEASQLRDEQQSLEPLRWKAEEFAADAIGHYYRAKNAHMDALMKDGWPKSSLDSVGKAASHAELKAKELAERVVATIDSRSFKVSQGLKMLGLDR
jgi:hypothetical protein